ncbi:integrase, catalytic region, zinc finger, CCHC-type containing protein [Tanacetum coccineum]
MCFLIRSFSTSSDTIVRNTFSEHLGSLDTIQRTMQRKVTNLFMVYYLEGLGHNLFSVEQFCDSDLEVAFRKHSCFVRDTDGVELIKGSRGSNLYTISVEDMMKSSLIFLLSKASKNKSWLWHRRLNHLTKVTMMTLQDRINQENDVVKRWNRTLVEAARTMLIFSKAPLFLWAEVVATTCYTQNGSIIYTRQNKTPYELVQDRKPDLTFFRVFGALCYPTNDSEDLGKLQPTADIGIFLTEQMDPVQLSTGPAPTFLTPRQISSGLVPNLVPAAPYVPPTNKELEILFQPMFDEYLEPPRVERPVFPAPAVSIPVNSVSTPSSTTIDQDVPSPKENPFAPVDNNPFINIFAPEPTSEASSSGDVSSTESTYVTQTLHHLGK